MMKLYEIINSKGKHVLVPEGYGGLSNEELQAQEDKITAENSDRKAEMEEIRQAHKDKARKQAAQFQKHQPPMIRRQKRKSKGVGDTVSRLIKKMTRGKVKECGGCKKRREALNKRFPYKGDSDGN